MDSAILELINLRTITYKPWNNENDMKKRSLNKLSVSNGKSGINPVPRAHLKALLNDLDIKSII